MRSLVPHSTANLGADIRTLLTANCSSNSGFGVSGLRTIPLLPDRLHGLASRKLRGVEPAITQPVFVRIVYRPRRRPTIASLIARRIRRQGLEGVRIISIPVVGAIVHPIVARHPVPPFVIVPREPRIIRIYTLDLLLVARLGATNTAYALVSLADFRVCAAPLDRQWILKGLILKRVGRRHRRAGCARPLQSAWLRRLESTWLSLQGAPCLSLQGATHRRIARSRPARNWAA